MSLIALSTRPIAEDLGLREEPTLQTVYWRSSNLCQNRHNLVREAQKAKHSHILWLDDDMTFPADTLARLLKHRKPIVGANCVTRSLPIITTAVKSNKRLPSCGRTGIEEVDQFGLAVVLTETAVFDKIPLPWFSFMWDPEYPDTYCSEDMYFCKKAKAAGFRIWVDHDLSNEIGHNGEITYTHDMTDHEPR